MTALTLEASIGQWVAQYPQTARVFESYQIDYCCGGGKRLDQVCRDKHLDPTQMLTTLEQVISERAPQPVREWLNAPLSDLCNHIEQTHHAYLHRELPRLAQLVTKVAHVHGAGHKELPEVHRVFIALCNEMDQHMFKEEKILFPAIRQLEQATTPPQFPFGTVANPIRMMKHEHDAAGAALARMRQLTQDYRVPEDACRSYCVMLDGLNELEKDLHQHVHLENNILFPRAEALENGR